MSAHDAILEALARLNRLLREAVARAASELGARPGDDPFRGLYVEREEAVAAWDRAGRPEPRGGVGPGWAGDCAQDPLFARWAQEFPRLDPTDYAVLLLALAPEFDPGYERVFGFLHDDVTRRRPTVGLAARLLDPVAGGRVGLLRRTSDVAPLRAHGLVELADGPDGRAGLFGKVLRPDDQFARRVFGLRALDRRLTGAASLTAPAIDLSAAPISAEIRAGIAALVGDGKRPVRLYLHGRDDRAKQAAAEGLARRLGMGFLAVDAGRLLAADRPFPETARVLAREGAWFGNLLFVERADAFHHPDRHREWAHLTAALARSPGPVVLAGARPGLPPSPHPVGFLPVELPLPDSDERARHWQEALGRVESPTAEGEVGALAERYTLTRSQIDQAVATAAARARWRSGMKNEPAGGPTFDDLAAAAKAEGSYELESLTHRIAPRVGLADLVVRPGVREQLSDVAARVRRRDWVLEEWGFGRRQSHGNGVNALFAGPSGTGKTMAAEAIAGELGKDLYKIDLTAVVSKYIGETEQRLEQVFQAAEQSRAVLFFDEADSLLGKRSEVRDAHDRYANIEVSYLLQRMERYDGLIVLATNLPGNLDDAFLRRMAAIVHFPAPGPVERRLLWAAVWPDRVPLAADPRHAIDFDHIAERFELTGGAIRNAALAAAFAAADRDGFRVVTMRDVLLAVRREFQKSGRAVSDADLGLHRYPAPPERADQDRGSPTGRVREAVGLNGSGH